MFVNYLTNKEKKSIYMNELEAVLYTDKKEQINALVSN
jgi:hypothetical protein